MTTWAETLREGHDRGLTGILHTWVAMVVRPRQFFHDGIAPDDQAPGLVPAIVVVLVYQGLGFAFEPTTILAVEGDLLVPTLVALLIVTLFVAPTFLHPTAVIQTALLTPLLSHRARVNETVQVIAYATMPCASANLPIPGAHALCTVYGAVLLVVGISEAHQAMVPEAAFAAAAPAGVVFGYTSDGFRTPSELAVTLALV